MLQIGTPGHGTQLSKIGTNAIIENRANAIQGLTIYATDPTSLSPALQHAIDVKDIAFDGSYTTVQA